MPGRRILIVDDNAENAEVLEAVLELWGHAPVVAYDLGQALAAMQTDPPDVVVLELALPRLEDGFALIRHLRAETRALIIALTGWGRAGDRRRALDAGCHAFLLKPAAIEELFQILDGAPSVIRRRTAG